MAIILFIMSNLALDNPLTKIYYYIINFNANLVVKKSKKVSNEELLEVINEIFTQMDGKISQMDGKISQMDGRLTKIEATMVTKDYLDEKLADLRGDMVILTRKEDAKVRKLVDILHKRKVITQKDAEQINAMEPFPELKLHTRSKI